MFNKVILVVFCLTSYCILKVVQAGGNSGCYAGPFVNGPVCSSTTSIIGHPSTKIAYSISFTGSTQLCCKAYYCKGNNCALHSIGCSNNGSLRTGSLKWGNIIATPKVQCKGNPFGSSYSFSH